MEVVVRVRLMVGSPIEEEKSAEGVVLVLNYLDD